MKIIITEKQALIEGKGTLLMLINLAVKAMIAIMVSLVEHWHMDAREALSIIHNCADIAAEEAMNITGGKENE